MDLTRYVRQTQFAPFGEAGQMRLAKATVLICGCGGLGSAIANHLVRAGVGHVRLVDRDVVDITNLHRQVLFDEADAAQATPKATAAAKKLHEINSEVQIEAIVAEVGPDNIDPFCQGVDVIVDGTDNFETRLLISDAAIRHRLPWVYGGVVGGEGQSMTFVPGQTGCLRCLLADGPPPGSTPTCRTVGVLGPAVGVIAAWQSGEAIKLLSGHREAVSPWLTVFDFWTGRVRQIDLASLGRHGGCPACAR